MFVRQFSEVSGVNLTESLSSAEMLSFVPGYLIAPSRVVQSVFSGRLVLVAEWIERVEHIYSFFATQM